MTPTDKQMLARAEGEEGKEEDIEGVAQVERGKALLVTKRRKHKGSSENSCGKRGKKQRRYVAQIYKNPRITLSTG